MNTKRQVVLWTVKGGLGILAAIAILCMVWAAEQPPSSTYERLVATPSVRPGEIFKLKVNVIWTKTCWSRLYRNLIDGAGKITPYEREPRLNKEGRAVFVIEAMVPLDASPGDAKWEVRTEWYCNPWQRWFPRSVQLEPIEFKILPREEVQQ